MEILHGLCKRGMEVSSPLSSALPLFEYESRKRPHRTCQSGFEQR